MLLVLVFKITSMDLPWSLTLLPAHVLVAAPIPDVWDVQVRLWHILRAIMCWLIWKDGMLTSLRGSSQTLKG